MHTELIDKSQISLDITLLIFFIIQKKKKKPQEKMRDKMNYRPLADLSVLPVLTACLYMRKGKTKRICSSPPVVLKVLIP